MPTQKAFQMQILTQLIQQSTQPSLLIEIDSNLLVECTHNIIDVLGMNKQELEESSFYLQITKKSNALIKKDLNFFNYEIFFNNKIFLIIAEVRNNFLIIYLQEKFNYNMPSSHLINILDSLGAYVYCKDKDYNFTYGNQMVGALFGVEHPYITGTAGDYLDDSSAAKVHSNADKFVIENQQEIEVEESVYIKHKNKTKTFLSVKKPLFGKNNEIIGLFGISTDITSYKAIEKKIRLNEQKLNTILDNVPAYIYIKDLDLNFTYVNKMTTKLFNLKEKEIIGSSTDLLLGKEESKAFRELDDKILIQKKVIRGIEKLTTNNGDLFYWTVKAPLFDEDEKFSGIIGMSTDISEQKNLEHKLEETNSELQFKIDEITQLQATLWEQATQDPLTQLFNRRYFNEIAHKEIIKCERNKKPIALLLLDADFFKKVNDNFGHNTGDNVLVRLSQIMIDQCRRTDIVCRFGGEEFVILMPEASQDIAFERAENIRITYEKEVTKMLTSHTTISIGIAMWDQNLMDLEGLTKAADQAMYQAKHNGRNQVIVYKNTNNL